MYIRIIAILSIIPNTDVTIKDVGILTLTHSSDCGKTDRFLFFRIAKDYH